MKKRVSYPCGHHHRSSPIRCSNTLHPDEHEILLGILKKVEAKNSVMATVWALFLGSITAAVSGAANSAASNELNAFAQSGTLFIAAGAPFIIALILGTRQLDNFSTLAWPRFRKTSCSARKLQAQLLMDAIIKEDLLWISQRGAITFALTLPPLATLFLWHIAIIRQSTP